MRELTREETLGTALIIGAGLALVALVALLEMVAGGGALTRVLGIAVLPLLGLGLTLLGVLREGRLGGGWPAALVGWALLGAGSVALNTGTAAGASVAIGPLMAGTVALARAAYHWRRHAAGDAVSGTDHRVLIIAAWLFTAAALAEPVAALRLGVLGLIAHWTAPLSARALAGVRTWLAEQSLGGGEEFVDLGSADRFSHNMPSDPYYEIKEQIREFIRANFKPEAWSHVDFAPSIPSPGYITHILKKPDNIDKDALIRKSDDLAIKLGLEPHEINIRLSGAKGGWLIEITKSVDDMTTIWFDETYPRYVKQLKTPRHVLCGLDPFEQPVIINVEDHRMPHTLYAGTTGSGKSSWIHSVMVQLLLRNSPDELRILWADAGQMTQDFYAPVAHLWRPLADDLSTMAKYMEELVQERDRRMQLFGRVPGVVDLRSYHDEVPDATLPLILLIVDEAASFVTLADEATQRRYQDALRELLQNGRKFGIHVFVGLQRPMVDTIGKGVRELLGRKMTLRLEEASHSETILGKGNDSATRLRSRGDAILADLDGRQRLQCLFLPDKRREAQGHRWIGDYIDDIVARWGTNDFESAFDPATASARKAEVAARHKPGVSDLEWLVVEALRVLVSGDADPYAKTHNVTGASLLPYFERVAEGYPFQRPPTIADIESVLDKIIGKATRDGYWIVFRATVEGTKLDPGLVGRLGSAAGRTAPGTPAGEPREGPDRAEMLRRIQSLPDRDDI